MKKFFTRFSSAFMAMILVLCMGTCAFAAEINENINFSTNISYNNMQSFYDAAVADARASVPSGTDLVYDNFAEFSNGRASVTINNTQSRSKAYIRLYVYDTTSESYVCTLSYNGSAVEDALAAYVVGNSDADNVGYNLINAKAGTYTVKFQNSTYNSSTGTALVLFFA